MSEFNDCFQKLAVLLIGVGLSVFTSMAIAQGPIVGEERDDRRDVPSRHVLIVIGLPGDEERGARFESISDTLIEWLTDKRAVDPQQITVLGRISDDKGMDSTQENVRRIAEGLCRQLDTDDSLLVFLLGHGSQDDRHGWFHLPGPDLNAEQWGGLFSELKAGEQVFWLTHSGSGRFLKPFSLPGRIVISATDDGEVNETRFPDALADVLREQLAGDRGDESVQTADGNEPEKPKSTPDQQTLSVLDLFRITSDQVLQSFDEQQLLPSEHAQLDDNGDGTGTEANLLADSASTEIDATAAQATIDGILARRTPLYTANTTEDRPDDFPQTTELSPTSQCR